MRVRAIISIAFSIVGASLASAQTPISFSFTGSSPGTSNPWNTGTIIASGLTQTTVFGVGVPGWSRASGLTGDNAANRYSTSGWTPTTNLATLIANNDYMGFGISVNPGFVMNLNGATVGITTQRNGQGPNQYVLMSNLPGYGLLATDTVMTNRTMAANNDVFTFVLPNTGLNNLTGSYEFRLIGLNAGSEGGTFSAGIDQTIPGFRIFNGTVAAIPEPASALLLGLGVAGAGMYFRNRKQNAALAQAEAEAGDEDSEA